MSTRRYVLGALAVVPLAGCADDGADDGVGDGDGAGPDDESFSISSPAFDERVPTRFTCEGNDGSPPLRVAGVPDDAASLALVVDDPDAPTSDPFVHWLLWNIPVDTTEIPADVPQEPTVESLDGARQGTNDFDEIGYRGPCPPAGDGQHTYRFTILALDRTLDLAGGATRSELDAAADAHRVGRATTTATFER